MAVTLPDFMASCEENHQNFMAYISNLFMIMTYLILFINTNTLEISPLYF